MSIRARRRCVILLSIMAVIAVFAAQASCTDCVLELWKTVFVDVDGDGYDEPLELRTDEDVYHLGAQQSTHGHVGILGSGPGWGLRYLAKTGTELLLDTGIRGGTHFYNVRRDYLDGDFVVTEWEADLVLLRRTIDLTEERALIVFELLNLTGEHIRDVVFESRYRFDDFIYWTSPDDQTSMGWDGFDDKSPDSPAIFKVLHLPKPEEFYLDPGQYGLTSAVWGPSDLCADWGLEFALIPIWNNGYQTIGEVIEYLDDKVAEYKAKEGEIIDPRRDCEEGVFIDIKPRSCPNPLNVKSGGVLPVAILGSASLDVTLVDVESILLEGVPPIRTAIEDVATPVGGTKRISPGMLLAGGISEFTDLSQNSAERGSEVSRPDERDRLPDRALMQVDPCECTTEGPDGYDDLTMKFEKQAVVAALGEVGDRDTLLLTLTAKLADGTELEGGDCVLILDNEERKKQKFDELHTQLVPGEPLLPDVVALYQNSPNPASGSTVIRYSLPERSRVLLTVHDALGRTVAVLADGEDAAGLHAREWKGDDASGVYFCRLEAGGAVLSRKMVVAR